MIIDEVVTNKFPLLLFFHFCYLFSVAKLCAFLEVVMIIEFVEDVFSKSESNNPTSKKKRKVERKNLNQLHSLISRVKEPQGCQYLVERWILGGGGGGVRERGVSISRSPHPAFSDPAPFFNKLLLFCLFVRYLFLFFFFCSFPFFLYNLKGNMFRLLYCDFHSNQSRYENQETLWGFSIDRRNFNGYDPLQK